MTTTTRWARNPGYDDWRPGDVGYLVRRVDLRHRDHEETRLLWREPARTNMSGAERIEGWCGTTNDVALYAEGRARVVRVTGGGDALQVLPLAADEQP